MPNGPIILFDKSFLQSLSPDEAVWLDHFFISNICPLFYVETLADISKPSTATRNQESIVASIADKTPEFHSAPCMHHAELCIANLFGHDLPFDGRIPIAGGRPVSTEDQSGLVFAPSPEAQAFQRWQRGHFRELERDLASKWRDELSKTNLRNSSAKLRALGCPVRPVRSLNEAAQVAKNVIDQAGNDFIKISYLCALLSLKTKEKDAVITFWRRKGCKPIRQHAPFAAHILEIETFFQLGLLSSLISSSRPSNRIDIAYLFYLPFTDIFVSSDKLHREATLAVTERNRFVWGPDLKSELQAINQFYANVSESEREKGLFVLAPHPPETERSLVRFLWNTFIPGWDRPTDVTNQLTPEGKTALARRLQELPDAPTATGAHAAEIIRDPSSMTVQRQVRAQRGSWWQLPKSVTRKKNGG
jgi:hypothetical protein